MSKKSTSVGVGKKVLASALSAAMVVAFAPAVALAEDGAQTPDAGVEGTQTPTADSQASMSQETLQSAINNANAGDTVKLTGDIVLTSTLSINKDIKLDGDGHTVSGSVSNGSFISVNVENADCFTIANCVFAPSSKVEPNGFVNLSVGGKVSITGCTFGQSGNSDGYIYNGLEFSQDRAVTDVTISGNTFYGGAFRHNCINLYKFANNSKTTIKNNTFNSLNWKTTNAIRLSNKDSVKTEIDIDSNTYSGSGTGTDRSYDGFMFLQSYGAPQDYKNTTIRIAKLTNNSDSKQLFYVYQDGSGLITNNNPVVIGDSSIADMTTTNGLPACTASVDGTYYGTLKDAVAAASAGSTVQLTQNINGLYGLNVDKKLTLDLNGKTITSDNSDAKYEKKQWPAIINVVGGGDLTVTGNGKIVGPKGDAGAALDSRTLITIRDASAKLTVLNGAIEAGGVGSNGMYGLFAFNGGTIVLGDEATKTGPTITSHFAPVGENFTKDPANVTIHGGSYTAEASPVKADGSVESWACFCAPLYLACSGKVDIQGGAFNGYYGLSTRYKDVSQELNISGGQFHGTANALYVGKENGSKESTADTNLKKIQITGGSFSSDPTDYVSSGYDVNLNDGFYVVSKHVTPSYPSGPSTPVTPKPDPEPTPEPAAPGTNVSGTDSAGNTVEATVTGNEKTKLPDGTEAAGSVEYKGTADASGSGEPASSADIPASVTTSDGTVYAVTKIADDAFNGQAQLQSVSIPATVVEIGARAFAGTGISSVELPEATATIGKAAFKGCTSLKTANISKAALTQIPADAFNGTSIASIDIPGTVETIGARAFKGTRLASVESNAKTIAKSAFAGCKSLKTASLPKATALGAYALSGTGLKKLSVPKVKTIGGSALRDASKLKALATGTALESIGSKALAGTQVKVVTIKSKKLTKKGVKNSLKGSKVTKVEVAVSGSKKTQDKYVSKYKEMFKKANSGKSVKVVRAKKAAK